MVEEDLDLSDQLKHLPDLADLLERLANHYRKTRSQQSSSSPPPLQKEKRLEFGSDNNRANSNPCCITGWIDKAISEKHLKYHKYQSFSDCKGIGNGSSATVYKAYSNCYMKYMVLKVLTINNLPSEKIAKQIVNELQQHREVDMHDNVIGFYGVTKNDSNEYMLVVEYANNGTLQQYLYKNFSKMNWDLKLKFAKQISSAVFCLHENNIIHRDLHPENIFIHSSNIKIGDFGLSKSIIDTTISFLKVHGSMRYSDPEYLRDPNNYQRTKASDVYSVGVLMWVISSGRRPFQSLELYNLLFNITNGYREEIIPGTPKFYVDIYTACWNADPKERPEISEVIELLDKVDVNNTVQNVENISTSSNSSMNNLSNDSRNSYEQRNYSSNSSNFEITSTMERQILNLNNNNNNNNV